MPVRKGRGLTLPEILVSFFIVFLILAMVSIVVSQLNAQAYRTEAVILARYDIQLLFKALDKTFEQTTAEGFHTGADFTSCSMQTIDGISLNGTRSWSPSLTFYHFDRETRQLFTGRVELSEIEKTHNPKLPASITDADLEKMYQLRRTDGKFRSVADQVDNFRVLKPNAVSAKVELTATLKSGKYKEERVEDERTFFFFSAAEL